LTKRIVSNKLIAFFNAHLINYDTPFNLNYIWSLGAMSGLCLVLQVVSGIFLAMHYVADSALAFGCVEYIMTDVKYG
jgi:ubiquinol-cytochrome c reductase cytochrome b subunit